jgi:hypothetical protein
MMEGVLLLCWKMSSYTGGGVKVENEAPDVFFLMRIEVPSSRWSSLVLSWEGRGGWVAGGLKETVG